MTRGTLFVCVEQAGQPVLIDVLDLDQERLQSLSNRLYLWARLSPNVRREEQPPDPGKAFGRPEPDCPGRRG